MTTPSTELTPELLLHAYANGIFPMADNQDSDDVFWVQPEQRGIMPLDRFHLSKSLAKLIRQQRYDVTINHDFEQVISACAQRDETWINGSITSTYSQMHALGFAHSIEVWESSELVGGLYGVSLGRAFFGESMFSRRPNTSKMALAYLVTQMKLTGYQLLDTQFITPHLAGLGGVEIPQEEFLIILKQALNDGSADLSALGLVDRHSVIQRSAQTS